MRLIIDTSQPLSDFDRRLLNQVLDNAAKPAREQIMVPVSTVPAAELTDERPDDALIVVPEDTHQDRLSDTLERAADRYPNVRHGVGIPGRARTKDHRKALDAWRTAYETVWELSPTDAEAVMTELVPDPVHRMHLSGDIPLMQTITKELESQYRAAYASMQDEEPEDTEEPAAEDTEEPAAEEPEEPAAEEPEELVLEESEISGIKAPEESPIEIAVRRAHEAVDAGHKNEVRAALSSVRGTKVAKLSKDQARAFVEKLDKLLPPSAKPVENREFTEWAQRMLGAARGPELREAITEAGFKSVFSVTPEAGAKIMAEVGEA